MASSRIGSYSSRCCNKQGVTMKPFAIASAVILLFAFFSPIALTMEARATASDAVFLGQSPAFSGNVASFLIGYWNASASATAYFIVANTGSVVCSGDSTHTSFQVQNMTTGVIQFSKSGCQDTNSLGIATVEIYYHYGTLPAGYFIWRYNTAVTATLTFLVLAWNNVNLTVTPTPHIGNGYGFCTNSTLISNFPPDGTLNKETMLEVATLSTCTGVTGFNGIGSIGATPVSVYGTNSCSVYPCFAAMYVQTPAQSLSIGMNTGTTSNYLSFYVIFEGLPPPPPTPLVLPNNGNAYFALFIFFFLLATGIVGAWNISSRRQGRRSR